MQIEVVKFVTTAKHKELLNAIKKCIVIWDTASTNTGKKPPMIYILFLQMAYSLSYTPYMYLHYLHKE